MIRLNSRISKDGKPCVLDDLGQVLQCGDVHYTYDPSDSDYLTASPTSLRCLGRLVDVQSSVGRWTYTYDAFNRCMSKTSYSIDGEVLDEELYFYCDQTDIGATDKQGSLRQFRMMGEDTVAIEVDTNLYASYTRSPL